MNYTYILRCRDETLYTGWTNNLEKRIQAHNSGKGAKYTKSRRPVELLYYEEYETKQEAMQREYAIKQLSRQEKLSLILHQISIHEDKMAGAAAHHKQMKDFMASEILWKMIKKREL